MSPERNGNPVREEQGIQTYTGPPPATISCELPEYIRASKSTLLVWLGKIKKHLGERQAWRYPLCLLVPLLFSLVTCTFNDFLFSPQDWKIIWIVIIIVIGTWLIIALCRIPKSMTDEEMLDELTKGMETFQEPSRFPQDQGW